MLGGIIGPAGRGMAGTGPGAFSATAVMAVEAVVVVRPGDDDSVVLVTVVCGDASTDDNMLTTDSCRRLAASAIASV